MSRLTDHDRFLIRRAREVGPALRAEGASIRDRLAGQLLDDLADLVERLDSGPEIAALVDTWRKEKAERLDLADGMFTDGNKSYQQGYADALDRCMQALKMLRADGG